MLTGHHIIGNEMQSSASHTQRKTKKEFPPKFVFIFLQLWRSIKKKMVLGVECSFQCYIVPCVSLPIAFCFRQRKEKTFSGKKKKKKNAVG